VSDFDIEDSTQSTCLDCVWQHVDSAADLPGIWSISPDRPVPAWQAADNALDELERAAQELRDAAAQVVGELAAIGEPEERMLWRRTVDAATWARLSTT
jgi:hypothetical protein